MRRVITEELWAVMGPLVDRAKRNRQGQRPELPDRLFFEALLYWGRTGIPWRDLPGEFGAWDAVYNRFRRWVHSGSMTALFELLTANPALGEVRRVLIDSTTVRAHQHAAGARRPKRLSPELSAAVQGLGRSRGGLTTKVIVTAADENTAVAVDIAPGQASDFTLAEGVIHATLKRGPVDEAVGDKGFDSDDLRGRLIDRGVCPVIPNKRNRVDPWPFDRRAYRERNKVERLFAKAKQFRRVGTRYDKLRATFLGLLHLVLGFIRLRSSVNTA